MTVTGASNTTWLIDQFCNEDTPCQIVEMDHYGQLGTGFLWCRAHGNVVGIVSDPT